MSRQTGEFFQSFLITEQKGTKMYFIQIDSLVDVPEEICDLNPQKTCRLVTKLIPKLEPKEECTVVPQESCNLKFSNPTVESKPLRTEWCLDERESQDATIEVKNYCLETYPCLCLNI